MEETKETKVFNPDEISKPCGYFELDLDKSQRTIILDKSNLIILKNKKDGRVYVHNPYPFTGELQ